MVRWAVGGLLIVVIGALGLTVLDGWQREEIRTTAPITVALRELAEFHAASARYSTLVEADRGSTVTPTWLSGERATVYAEGTVDAVVDLRAPVVTVADRVVTVHLPPVVLEPAKVDPLTSKVVSRTRGLAQRVAVLVGTDQVPDDAPLYAAAAAKLDEEARGSDLTGAGERSTRDTVARIARSLDFDSVVVFDLKPAA